MTPTDQVIANAINQDEFRGFSFVNPDYGKLSLASESPATMGNQMTTTTTSTADNTSSTTTTTTASSSIDTATTTDTLSSNVTLTATNSSPKSTAANESYS